MNRANSWSKRELRVLRREYATCADPRELASRIGRTYHAVKTKAPKIGLKRSFTSNTGRTKLTPAQDAYLKRNYLTIPPQRLADRFGVSETCVKCRIKQLGLVVPREVIEQRVIDSRLKKGNTPPNKGKKWNEFMSKEGMKNSRRTTFKKGNLPVNTLYDGAIRIRRDKTGVQYLYIRVGLAKWEPLHRMVWRHHKGKIPPRMLIVFKDGNQGNCNIDNLEMISMADNLRRNSWHNYPKEIGTIIQLRGALNRQINKHLKALKK